MTNLGGGRVMKAKVPLIAFVLSLELVLVLAVFWAVGGLGSSVVAAGSSQVPAAPAAELHVCPLSLPTCDYTSIQEAVDDAAPGTDIKIAEGFYTDVHVRNGITQVVYISKSLNLLGGYIPGSWDTYDLVVNTTFVDAGGQGRGIVITDEASVWLNGLYVTGGDATGLAGGPPHGYDGVGGGIYVNGALVSLDYCTIYDNVATTQGWGGGGGAYLYNASGSLMFNTFHSNTASTGTYGDIAGEGGGLAMAESNVNLYGNIFQSNTASIADDGIGGGLYVEGGSPTLENTSVQANVASATTRGDGGGIYLFSTDAELVNTVVVDNVSGVYPDSEGAGLALEWANPRLKHTTIHGNTGGDGSGLTILPSEGAGVIMTNTILVDQSVGISVADMCNAVLDGVLWFGNGKNTGGPGDLFVTNDITGTPDFALDGYHLQFASAAINAGVDGGVIYDIDGQDRPYDLPDLGADEFVAVTETVDPIAGGTLTFTDTQGLTTTVGIPSGAVSDPTVLTLVPLLTSTHPLPPGDCFAGHAFFLDSFCGVGARIYLPLLMRWHVPNLNATMPGADIPLGLGLSTASRAQEDKLAGPALLGLSVGSSLATTSDWFPCGITFRRPVTITIRYSEDDIDCVTDENSLRLYYWAGSQWDDAANTCMPPSIYITDTVGNVLGLPICHLTEFAIRGD